MCNNVCVNQLTDDANCGVCGNVCATGSTCVSGKCSCANDTLVPCPGGCVDILVDYKNCGACGVLCAAHQLCLAGTCTCDPGLVACNGQCVDTQADPANCGGCGMTCPGGVCAGGACVGICPAGTTNCQGACLTDPQLQNDVVHCGGCATSCASNQLCIQGACQNAYSAPAPSCAIVSCGAATVCCTLFGKAVCVSGPSCPG